jgi:hypothetical protein
VGRPASHGVPRAPCYSGNPLNGDLLPSHTGLSPSVVGLSRPFRWQWFCNPSRPLNPGTNPGLGCVRFRSPLLTESMSLSSPAGTEMFQFPAFAPAALCIQAGVTAGRAVRFPDSDIPGSTLVCQLPGAYRRLPRPSSPLDAKTSTVHP